MNLTGIVDVSNYTLSVSVLGFAFHLDDFDSVADFDVIHKYSLV
jgi:hypothetical protein